MTDIEDLEFSDEDGGPVGDGIVIAENYRNATGGEIYEYVPLYEEWPKYYKYVYVWTDDGYSMDVERSRKYINGLSIDTGTDRTQEEDDRRPSSEDGDPSEIYIVMEVEAGLGVDGPHLGTRPIAAYLSQERADEHVSGQYDQIVVAVTVEDIEP